MRILAVAIALWTAGAVVDTEASDSAANTCTLYGIKADICYQVAIGCKYKDKALKLDPAWKEGTCSSQGYSMAVEDTCTLYGIKAAICYETAIDCKFKDKAEKLDPAAKEGTCSSQGYTVKGKEVTKHVPLVGKVVVDEYTKPSMAVEDTCRLYGIKAAICYETAIDCKYKDKAEKLDPAAKEGTCSSQGYTVKGKEVTKHVPLVGKVVVDEYTKPPTTINV